MRFGGVSSNIKTRNQEYFSKLCRFTSFSAKDEISLEIINAFCIEVLDTCAFCKDKLEIMP